MRIGLCGYGNMGRHHSQLFRKHAPAVELAGIADASAERRELARVADVPGEEDDPAHAPPGDHILEGGAGRLPFESEHEPLAVPSHRYPPSGTARLRIAPAPWNMPL